jgi:hypothetical protein
MSILFAFFIFDLMITMTEKTLNNIPNMNITTKIDAKMLTDASKL